MSWSGGIVIKRLLILIVVCIILIIHESYENSSFNREIDSDLSPSEKIECNKMYRRLENDTTMSYEGKNNRRNYLECYCGDMIKRENHMCFEIYE